MALAAPRVRGSPQDQSNRSAVVTVVGYFYHVEFANDGSQNHSTVHRVGKDRRCTCPLGDRCPAVAAVAAYLKSGGERAPDPPPGFYPVAPSICPICRAPAVFDKRLSSVRRGAGWRCTQAGGLHYWDSPRSGAAPEAGCQPLAVPAGRGAGGGSPAGIRRCPAR